MKKISFSAILLSSLLLAFTGCMKDQDFEDQKYGIQISNIRGVAFPQAASSPLVIGVISQTTPQTVAGPFITLESADPATSDVNVRIDTNSALVRAVTSQTLTLLPSSAYTISTKDVVIKAGQRFDSTLKITVANASLLDPNITYGLGLRITTVSGGYTIAENSRNIVLAFNIKNKYDGKYTLRGHFLRTDLAAYTGPFTTSVNLITSSPNAVGMYWPLASAYAQPWANAGALTYFSNVAPNIIFNSTTNKVTGLTNITGTPPMTPSPGYDSRYDPATKTIFVKYYYNTDPTNRIFTDTLIYTGPR